MTDRARFLSFCRAHAPETNSEHLQDLFVRWALDEMRGGFFVEFGAADGLMTSNTLVLERRFGWGGVLAEAVPCWHPFLDRNRACAIDHRAVWCASGRRVVINEVAHPLASFIDGFGGVECHEALRAVYCKQHSVETVTLADLLRAHGAPQHVDYLSVDVEGAELEALQDCGDFTFGVITVEHNFLPRRGAVLELLRGRGYVPVFAEISGKDDWLVRALG